METGAKRHELQVVASAGAEPATPAREAEGPRLGLTWLDKLGVESFVDGEKTQLLELVRSNAAALAGADRNEARLRLLSRAIASLRAQESMLEAAMAERLASRDDAGVAILDRVLTNIVKRLTMLLGEHRLHCATDRRTALVAIGAADAVIIKATE